MRVCVYVRVMILFIASLLATSCDVGAIAVTTAAVEV